MIFVERQALIHLRLGNIWEATRGTDGVHSFPILQEANHIMHPDTGAFNDGVSSPNSRSPCDVAVRSCCHSFTIVDSRHLTSRLFAGAKLPVALLEIGDSGPQVTLGVDQAAMAEDLTPRLPAYPPPFSLISISPGLQDGVVGLGRCVLQAGSDVLGLEIGIVLKNLLFRDASGQQVENVPHTDAHSPNARPPTTLPGIERDAVQVAHAWKLTVLRSIGEPSFASETVRAGEGHRSIAGGRIYTEVKIRQLQDVHARCHPSGRLASVEIVN